MSKLFDLLAEFGGKIVSSNDLTPEDINQAIASGRMFVDGNSLGYVWIPTLKAFPETVWDVKQFEKWFPLDIKLPKELDDCNFLALLENTANKKV